MSPTWILWKKELTDALRDRRTLAMMIFLPIALYPLMFLGIGAVMAAGMSRLAKEEIVVGLLDDQAARLLPAQLAPPHTAFAQVTREEAEAGIRDGKRIGAAVGLDPSARAAFAAGEPMQVTLLFTERHDFSIEARDRVRTVFKALGVQFVEKRLSDAHLPLAYAEPLKVEEKDIDFDQNLGPVIASHMLPMILLIMLFTGAFYTAVDVTAGEKERGTLETLLVAPVRPIQVMAGKYLAVCTVSIVATGVNLGAMAATFRFGLEIGDKAKATLSLTGGQIAVIGVSLLPATMMVSALSLAVASLARTFKEGQSVLSPLMLIGIAPGMAAQMPGIELSNLTAMIPLVNVALVVKAAVLGTVTGTQLLLTFASISVCALGALWLAANAFQSEALRFGGTEGWRDLFRFSGARRPSGRSTPPVDRTRSSG